MCLCVNSIGMELLEDVVEAVDLEAVDLAVDVEDGNAGRGGAAGRGRGKANMITAKNDYYTMERLWMRKRRRIWMRMR